MTQTLLQSGAELPLLAVFTDFDGTLVDIAETPDDIHVPNDLADQIDRATRDFDHAFAVITVARSPISIASCPLFNCRSPGPMARSAAVPMEPWKSSTATLIAGAEESFPRAIGATGHGPSRTPDRTQDGTVALHYRQAPDLADPCLRAMEEALQDHPEIFADPGQDGARSPPRRL